MPPMSPMVWPVLAMLVTGFLIALPATAVLVRLGHRTGALDSAGADGHAKALRFVPNIGGIAIWLGVAAPLGVGLLLLTVIPAEAWERLLPPLAEHLERVRSSVPAGLALFGCITALHVLGLVDDRKGLGPWSKLGVQVAVAAVMVVAFDVRLLTAAGPVISIGLTIAWIIVITNAVNFLDNMDGLAGGVAAIIALLLLIATLVNHQWFIAATLALLVGSLAGFLVFNFPPARIFMGDGGSLIVGFLLAVLTVRTTFYDPEQANYPLGNAWYGVLMPLVILAIPIYDFLTVVILRLRQGRSPLVGDQQHYSHRLVMRGMSQRGAVIVIWAATLVTGIGGIGLGRLAPWQAVLVGAQTIAVLVMLGLIEHASRHAVERSGAEDPARDAAKDDPS